MKVFPSFKRWTMILAITMIVFAQSGCSLFNNARSGKISVYQLELAKDFGSSIPKRDKPLCDILLVSTPLSAPGLASARMAYVHDSSRLEYFADNQWVDTPARMLSPLLVRAMDASGLFKHVVVSPAPIDADLRLESEIASLKQVFEGARSQVELELRVSLFDLKRRDVVISKRLKVADPAKSNDPQGGVGAANRAVTRLMSDLISVLSDSLSRRGCN